jgi:CubicO group peptidase (beta-lactamase class C family)
MGQSPIDRLDALIEAGCGSIFTGAALLVWCPDATTPLLERYYGATTEGGSGEGRKARSLPIDAWTLFDIASITKVFTATTLLRLIDTGCLQLDERLVSLIPEFDTGDSERRAITLFHLLTHTAGLPAFERLYEWFPHPEPDAPDRYRAQALAHLYRVPLAAAPGSDVEYSDIGFILLGVVIERTTGLRLDEAMTKLVLAPLELSAHFRPQPEEPVVATEIVPWRGERAHGEVHDENAVLLGGVAGHAGLFACARDVARLGLLYARGGEGLLSPELVRLATSEQAHSDYERRGFGFELRSPLPEASVRSFSASTCGHHGFTGTALWIDPERAIVVTLLTNRVYYGREAEGIVPLRRAVFDTVCELVHP